MATHSISSPQLPMAEVAHDTAPIVPSLLERVNWVYQEGSAHKLSLTEAAVLFRVAYRAGPPNGECYESQAGIAEVIRVSRPWVNRSLKRLVSLGLLTSHPRHRQPTTYRPIFVSTELTMTCTDAGCLKSEGPWCLLSRHQGVNSVDTNQTLNKKTMMSDDPMDKSSSSLSSSGEAAVGKQGEEQELASAIRAALKEFEGIHTWRNHEAAVHLYLKDLDAFKTDRAGWERAGKPEGRYEQSRKVGRYY